MAGKPVARLGDPGSHGGSISTGSSPIFVNSLPIALVGDTYACPLHGSNPITTGAPHVFGLEKKWHMLGRKRHAELRSQPAPPIHLLATLVPVVLVASSLNF